MGRIGVTDGPIPAHRLDRRVLTQPRGPGVGRPVRQDIDDTMTLSIDHHSGIAMSFSERPVITAETETRGPTTLEQCAAPWRR